MRKLPALLLLLGLVAASPRAASASSILFDRGLPTANLNNAAGASRSNVTWAFTQATASDYWLVGDDLTIGGSGSYLVDTLRVWSTSSTGLSLWFGAEGGSITQVAGAPTVTSVTYAGGASYQGSSGSYLQLYQIDFSLNQILTAGTTYQFFLGGPIASRSGGTVVDAFIHSSNALLSGSTQQGSNDQLLYANVVNGVIIDIGPWDSNGFGWDKSSDGNVQIYGTPVPEPSTLILLGAGLLGLAKLGRKKIPQKQA